MERLVHRVPNAGGGVLRLDKGVQAERVAKRVRETDHAIRNRSLAHVRAGLAPSSTISTRMWRSSWVRPWLTTPTRIVNSLLIASPKSPCSSAFKLIRISLFYKSILRPHSSAPQSEMSTVFSPATPYYYTPIIAITITIIIILMPITYTKYLHSKYLYYLHCLHLSLLFNPL